MNNTEIQPIRFDKDYYTLPEAIKQICEKTFGIDFKKFKENKKTEYRTISANLRRNFEKAHQNGIGDIKKDQKKRKTQYSRAILNDVVNDKLYLWLCKKFEIINLKELKLREDRRKSNRQKYADDMEEIRREYLELQYTGSDIDRLLDEAFRRRKIEIALEYIFDKYIELDEKLLRQDIALTFYIDDFDPSPAAEAAANRMKKFKNYYKEKKGEEEKG